MHVETGGAGRAFQAKGRQSRFEAGAVAEVRVAQALTILPAASQRNLAIFTVGEAGFLQIEVALDPPPRLVGDPAVAQQGVNALALDPDQFPRQFGADGRLLVSVGVERLRQLAGAGLVPRAQQPENFFRHFGIAAAGLDPDNLPTSDPSKMNFGTGSAKAWKDIWGAGQGISAVKAVVPVAELVARLKHEYDEARQRVSC